jgi:hypothetical protein
MRGAGQKIPAAAYGPLADRESAPPKADYLPGAATRRTSTPPCCPAGTEEATPGG